MEKGNISLPKQELLCALHRISMHMFNIVEQLMVMNGEQLVAVERKSSSNDFYKTFDKFDEALTEIVEDIAHQLFHTWEALSNFNTNITEDKYGSPQSNE